MINLSTQKVIAFGFAFETNRQSNLNNSIWNGFHQEQEQLTETSVTVVVP